MLCETLGQCLIKYFALKTSSVLTEIVNEGCSVIVAGNLIYIFPKENYFIGFISRRNNETSNI